MAYPKPLSEKTLARMYREANIDEEKSEFLHKLFLAPPICTASSFCAICGKS